MVGIGESLCRAALLQDQRLASRVYAWVRSIYFVVMMGKGILSGRTDD
jgi:hypothetical protein